MAIMRRSPRLATLAVLLLYPAIPTFGSAQTVQIPRGMRAVKIRIADDLSAVAGDRVDLLVTANQGATRVVLQNLKVVSADKNTLVVTFFLSPDDAQRATDADAQGKFSLRLRKSN